MKKHLFVDKLTTLDFSYLHPTRGIVGETWIMDLELHGELDEQSMLLDFGRVKKEMKAAAEGLIDHKLAVPDQLSGLQVSDHPGGCGIRYSLGQQGSIIMKAPESAFAFLPVTHISPENVEPLLNTLLQSRTPSNVHQVKAHLRTESIQGAYYHYSHGLKKHDGDCQRIAHGHRSRLEIETDGQRSQLSEYQWAKRWRDIYIGSQEDLKQALSLDGVEHLEFAYEAAQGYFELTLPRAQVYLLDKDSTVECIAEHIALQLKEQCPDNQFRVKAYEGLNKGAVAEV